MVKGPPGSTYGKFLSVIKLETIDGRVRVDSIKADNGLDRTIMEEPIIGCSAIFDCWHAGDENDIAAGGEGGAVEVVVAGDAGEGFVVGDDFGLLDLGAGELGGGERD